MIPGTLARTAAQPRQMLGGVLPPPVAQIVERVHGVLTGVPPPQIGEERQAREEQREAEPAMDRRPQLAGGEAAVRRGPVAAEDVKGLRLRRGEDVPSEQPRPIRPFRVFVVGGEGLVERAHGLPGLPRDEHDRQRSGRRAAPPVELTQIEMADAVVRSPVGAGDPIANPVEERGGEPEQRLRDDRRNARRGPGAGDQMGQRPRPQRDVRVQEQEVLVRRRR